MNNILVYLLQFVLPRRYWYRRFYLRSEHWRKLRADIIADRDRCEKCGSRGDIPYYPNYTTTARILDVHHLTYIRMWHEKPEDLRVLCRKCHNKEHAK